MKSPDKIRLLNAVQHIESEEVPLLESAPDMVIVNKMMGVNGDANQIFEILALHNPQAFSAKYLL